MTAGIEQFDISSSYLIYIFAHTVSLFSFERINSSKNKNSSHLLTIMFFEICFLFGGT